MNRSVTTFTLKIDNTVVSEQFGIQAILVYKEVGKIPTARLTILDGDVAAQEFATSNQDFFVPGKELELLLGYKSEETTVFKGIIVKHRLSINAVGNNKIVIDCKDKAVKTTIGKKSRYFYKQYDHEVLDEILGNYDLGKDIADTTVQYEELVQYYATDWDFLCCRTEANGQLIFIDDGKITIKAPDLTTESVLTLTFGENIFEFDAEIDARDQLNATEAKAWDYAQQEVSSIETDYDKTVDAGNFESDDLANTIGLETLELQHGGYKSNDELQAWANSRFQRARLSKIRGTVKTYGTPAVKPGDMVLLEGIGDRFNGKVFVSAIRHEVTHGVWETALELGLAAEAFTTLKPYQATASELIPAIQGVHIGIVSQLEEDPAGEDRILVYLPIIGSEEEGVWSRVCSLDAGENRGAFFRPEIGDEVLLAFINNDPRDAVVLGMLHSSAKPSPITATDDNHEKGFITRSELKLLFDDDKKSIQATTPAGKKFILDDDAGVASLEDENGNKIILDSNGITIESAKDIILKASGDLKCEGLNIENTAQAQFSASGSAGIELKTDAVAVLKGAIVQIN